MTKIFNKRKFKYIITTAINALYKSEFIIKAIKNKIISLRYIIFIFLNSCDTF